MEEYPDYSEVLKYYAGDNRDIAGLLEEAAREIRLRGFKREVVSIALTMDFKGMPMLLVHVPHHPSDHNLDE
jgi:hypothetical protein